MHPGPRRTIVLLLATIGLAAGCAQSGALGTRPMMVGSLKTEVTRLEQEKESYRRKMVELEKENSRIASELTEERAFSGDLEARLGDARALLDRRGLAADPRAYDSPPAYPAANWDDSPTVRTQPASTPQSSRKPPFAEIQSPSPGFSGLNRSADPPREQEPRYAPGRDAQGAQSRAPAPVRWLPVADTAAKDSTQG